MKKISILLVLASLVFLIGIVGTAQVCEPGNQNDFYWIEKSNSKIKFIPCHPEKFDYYKWSFDDGGFYATHQDYIVHTYRNPGTFEVRMEARNTYGNSVETYNEITINDRTESLNLSTSSFARKITNLPDEAKLGIGVGIVILIMLI